MARGRIDSMIALSQRYTYLDICMSLQLLADCYSEIAVCRTAGRSQDGRRIPMLRLGLGRQICEYPGSELETQT